jgi:hypothetical protein
MTPPVLDAGRFYIVLTALAEPDALGMKLTHLANFRTMTRRNLLRARDVGQEAGREARWTRTSTIGSTALSIMR